MTVTLWPSATINAFSSTLSASINSSATTITIDSVTGLSTTGGVLVIDRQDGSGNATPNKREFITYTGISSTDLTGVTRGAAGSTAQAHASGSLIEETFSVTHWLDLQDFLKVGHTATGLHVLSAPTIANARMITSVQASGASLVGSFPLYPVWVLGGNISGSTTIAGEVRMPRAGNFEWFSIQTRTPVSTASLVVTISKNGTNIFAGVTAPRISASGTYASTASLNTKVFVEGDVFRANAVFTGDGFTNDITVQGKAVL